MDPPAVDPTGPIHTSISSHPTSTKSTYITLDPLDPSPSSNQPISAKHNLNFQESTSRPHEKLNSFQHDTTPTPPYNPTTTDPYKLSQTEIFKLLAPKSKHFWQDAFRENLGAERVGRSQPEEGRDGAVEGHEVPKGKVKAEEHRKNYFGAESKMQVESVRNSPSREDDYEQLDWGKKGSAAENDSGDKVHGWGRPSTPAPLNTWSGESQIWTLEDRGRWDGRAQDREFETRDGDAKKGWGACGGDDGHWGLGINNGNNGGPWGANPGINQQHHGEDANWNLNQQQERQGHVRSRHQPQATVRPLPQTQQRLPSNHRSLQETHTYHYHHDHIRQTPNQELQKEQDQELIKELRTQNANQAELIAQQRIRIAVQNNELKHISKAREDTINALIVFSQTCSSTSCLSSRNQSLISRQVIEGLSSAGGEDEIKKLKHQIKLLERQNELLWDLSDAGVKSLRNKVDRRIQESTSDEDPVPPVTPSRRRTTSSNLHQPVSSRREVRGMIVVDEVVPRWTIKEKDKGKERMPDSGKAFFGEDFHVASSNHNEEKRRVEGLRKAFEKDKAVTALKSKAVEASTTPAHRMAQTSGSEPETKSISGWNESFTADIPTVPNSPLIHISSTSCAAKNQLLDNFPVSNTMLDVGLQSLDEFLEGDMNEEPHARQNQNNNKHEKLPSMTEQIKQHMEAIISLENAPAPLVLKTGFDMRNSKRGAEYNHLVPQPTAHRGEMNSYDRFSIETRSGTTTGQLWSSSQERERAIVEHKRACGRERDAVQYPDFFRYGIQYIPEEDDENYHRTVVISNLPGDIKLRDVLARVRGGLVTNAILMDTRKLMGGKMSAMVVFLEDNDAQVFVNYAASHPITFTCGKDEDHDHDNEQKVSVSLIATPTYPMHQSMIKRRKSDRKNTRCIAILNIPENFSLSKLQYDIACQNTQRAETLLELYVDEHNTLHLEFSNMAVAGSAFGILTNWMAYRGLDVIYERDPCSGPLEELALPVRTSPEMLPQNRLPSPPYDLNSSYKSSNEQDQQRKRLAVLTNQKVVIPSFSGSGIKSSSWADEVNEEAGSSGNGSSSSNHTYQSKLPLQPKPDEHDEHDEPIDRLSAPPSSPHDGVQLNLQPNISVKEAVDKIMIDDINAIMRQNPGFFKDRIPHVGLVGSKYATAIPGFEDRGGPVRRNGGRRSLRTSLTEEAENSKQPSATNRRKPLFVQTPPPLKLFSELGPGSLLESALYLESKSGSPAVSRSEFGRSSPTLAVSQGEATPKASRSGSVFYCTGPSGNLIPYYVVPPALKFSHFAQEHKTSPAQEGKYLPRVPTLHPDPFRTCRTQSSTSSSSLPQQASESSTSYTLPKPTFSPVRSPVQKSPTHKSKQLGQHTTPLADFNRVFESKLTSEQNPPPIPFHSHPRNQVAPLRLTAPPPKPFHLTKMPQTPQNERQNAEVYNKKVVRQYYKSSEGVPEGEWTQEDIEALKKSSPKTKERYVRLIEMGRSVGEFGKEGEEVKKITPDSEDESEGSDPFLKGGGKDGEGKHKVMEKFDVNDDEKAGEETGEKYDMKACGSKGKDIEKAKAKTNPDEIDLDLEDDDVGAGSIAAILEVPPTATSKPAEPGSGEKRLCTYKMEGCEGYMSIGG